MAPGPDPKLHWERSSFPSLAEFDSEDAYWAYIEEVSRRNNALPRSPASDPPRVRPRDRRGSVQVGLRLPLTDFERLEELGAAYGVAPATMARMLVVRAVRGPLE